MAEPLSMSPAERDLLVELLEREQAELPVEIRHTRTAEFRDELHHRQDVVRGLLDRLKVPAVT